MIPPATGTAPTTGYAPLNGLEMYYEIHGEAAGPDAVPVLLLHGAYMSTGTFGPLLPALAETRQVVVCDLQGHGRTTDADRPITYEGLADDAAALLGHLGLAPADVVGYSMGGGVALQLGVRSPEVVRRLVVMSASYTSDGMQRELLDMIPSISPEVFAGTPIEAGYREIAPDPDRFPMLVDKLKTLDMTPFSWPPEAIRAIPAPTMIVVGDADAIRLEHAVELYRLRGGGAMGDLAGLSRARLAVVPGTTHYMPEGRGLLDRWDWLCAVLTAFLDEPEPEPGPTG
ncbi:alpha/beta fold hydrolase [Geodermatophilus sp. CPCC 205506]|uniref:alpha/beta fold hydrolase n=1 Tax=Geodermatophilus sp. CPCC 205506 TaxID=2936596 RepID=UPI003EEDC04F